jgi:hypothetical protein
MASPKSKKLDLVLNIAFNVCNLFALLYLIRLSSDVMAPLIFSFFMLARRYASAIANFLQLGTSQTLLRHLPLLGGNLVAKKNLLLAGHLIYAVLFLVTMAVAYFFSDCLGALLFGSGTEYAAFTFWTLALSVVTVGQFLVYSTAIAERHIILANLINFFSTTGWFLVAILYYKIAQKGAPDISSLESILGFHTICVLVSSLLAFVYYMKLYGREGDAEGHQSRREDLRTYWSYGVPRTAITFLDSMTLVIGPWLLRHYPIEAGYIVVALSLLRMIQGLLMPISQLSGVFAAEALGANNETYLSRMVRFMLGGYSFLTLLTAVFLLIWMDVIVDIWLSDPGLIEGVLKYSDIVILSILPFVLFNGLKQIIENIWHAPKNLISLVVSFVLFGLAFFFFDRISGATVAVKAAYLAMFWGLGGACLVWLRSYLQGSFRYFLFVDWLFAIVAVHLTSRICKLYLGDWGILPAALVAALVTAILVFKSQSKFFAEIRQVFLKNVSP